jgi:virulence factor Mce-like protein
VRRRSRITDFRAGVLAIAALVAVIYLGFTKAHNPFADPFEVRAAFTTANQLKPKSPVRIAGVQVGKVSKVETLGRKGAMITMEIDDRGLPIKKDATVKIRPRIFLEGNYFVDIEPGSPSARQLRDGDTVPITQTAAPVGFGRVLETFQRSTREDLQTLLAELGTGLSGGGAAAFNRATRHWEGAFRDSAIVNDATRGVLEHDLSRYIEHAGVVAEGLDRDPRALKELVTGFAQTADALATEQASLRRAIGTLDDTIVQGHSAFGELNRAFPPLRRLVTELRPAARAARPALDAQLKLVPELRRLMSRGELLGLANELRPLVPELVHLNEGGVPLQEQARLLSSCSLQVSLPTLESKVPDKHIEPTGMVYEEGVKWMPGIAGESRSFDAHGQYIKTLAQTANYAYALGDGRFYFTTKPIQGVNPPKAAKGHPPLRPDVPCETQEPPDLRTVVGDPPRAIKVNRDTPEYRERAAKALDRSVQWLTGQLEREGLDGILRVTKEPYR